MRGFYGMTVEAVVVLVVIVAMVILLRDSRPGTEPSFCFHGLWWVQRQRLRLRHRVILNNFIRPFATFHTLRQSRAS